MVCSCEDASSKCQLTLAPLIKKLDYSRIRRAFGWITKVPSIHFSTPIMGVLLLLKLKFRVFAGFPRKLSVGNLNGGCLVEGYSSIVISWVRSETPGSWRYGHLMR